MKTLLKLNLSLAAVASFAASGVAQIEGPPALIDYQGRVLDAQGDPVAMGTTENIEMYFRIWNHITQSQGTNLVWAEKQIVTVADGNFSVRLGEGDQIQVSAGDNTVVPAVDDPRASLLGVFDAKNRFLGVSVAPNSVTKPQSEILPRLAFLTAPFSAIAEKARFAEFGPVGGIFSADQVGIGTTTPNTQVHVSNTASLNLLLEADSDDVGEGDQPSLTFSQDGGNQETSLGFFNSSDDFSIQTNGANRLIVQQSGNVGIGTSPPVEDLHVWRADSDIARIYATGTSQGGGMFYAGQSVAYGGGLFYEGDNTPAVPGSPDRTVLFRRNNGNDAEVISYHYSSNNVKFTGRIGIGTESPTDSIHVAGGGNIRLDGGRLEMQAGVSDGLQWWYDGGFVPAGSMFHDSNNRLWVLAGLGGGVYMNQNASSWTSNSDERLKSDLEPLTGILDKIEKIRVVGYNMANRKTDSDTGKITFEHTRPPRKLKSGKIIKHEIGTIAQDWLEQFPELVTEPEDKNDYYGLSYDRIGVVAIGAAQELSHMVKEIQAIIKQRDAKIADLEARLAKLEALLMSAAK